MNEVVSGLETRILTGIPHASQALVAHLHVGGGGGGQGPQMEGQAMPEGSSAGRPLNSLPPLPPARPVLPCWSGVWSEGQEVALGTWGHKKPQELFPSHQ